MTGNQSFAVYLTDETDLDGDPLQADSIDFYDSGVWVSHTGGRDFFPYGRVLRIREGAVAEETESDAQTPTGERRDASSGTTGAVDETELDVE
jgi:hypothetical protein